MFGDKSTFGSRSKHAQKRSTRKTFLYNQQGPITHLLKRKFAFKILLQFCKFLRELGNEKYIFFHFYTFKFKKA